MQIKFQRAQHSDLPFIVKVYNETVASRMVTADLEPVTVAQREPWFAAHQQRRRPLWLITADGQPAGWLSLSDYYGRAAYHNTVEISLYIDEQFRGQHIGQQSLAFVEQQAPTLGIKTVLSFIFGHNQPSLHLFTKQGYRQWGKLPQVAELDGEFRDLVILGKQIN
ncbi:GNAT family N-acetyltransferase [Loigolactobacillus coryniformis]|uniref:GNAT family N-acetyltransferase n=1 Tax=Loigolactobacillus coryniformis TaxID=1610 RepID=UPI001C5D7CB7|nr:GNAT family N-acetyltransferase [Loigolactobacillus coryniformis]MBW4803033.1 N-acetyltransferase [Loigolactobacillus coryniformis subsp. torquens]MBW4805729.1 N-acetyltransferase [Loigolactobacillus coryniformis subsp. torquens]